MKIRKILPLLLLAFGSVFLLSSCDALLDAIFSNNTISVYVSVYIPSYGYSPYDTVSVSVSGEPLATAGYSGDDGLYMYWSVSVPKLSDGLYSVTVYLNHVGGLPPFGVYPSTQSTYLPASSGNPHNVNLDFVYN